MVKSSHKGNIHDIKQIIHYVKIKYYSLTEIPNSISKLHYKPTQKEVLNPISQIHMFLRYREVYHSN